MQSVLGSKHQKSGLSALSALCAVDLKLTHLDWNPEETLIHFQGQYPTICELDYKILQVEIQKVPKTKVAVDIGEFCLVEDLNTTLWYRGRVQNRKKDLFGVFLIDHGNVLSVNIANISSCSNDLFILPPKIVCGFLANVLLLQACPNSGVEEYLSSLIGRSVAGYIQALLPHQVLLLETPDINIDIVRQGLGRHVDTDTFLLLVELLTEVPLERNLEPVPDLLIERSKSQEFSFKSSSFKEYEDFLSFCGSRLSCGTRAKVRVTSAVHPGLFYCQRACMEKDLWEMSKKLSTICECRTKEPNQKTSENLGLLCAVKGRDEKWYRGFVQFLPVNSQVRVLFIDYGFFESVRVENVHRLPSDFDSTPIMAFPCSLYSLSDQEAKAQQLSFLKEGLLGRVLDVEIKGCDEEQHLYSVTVIGAEGNNVTEIMGPKMKAESDSETEESPPLCGYLYQETVMCGALGKSVEAEEVQVGSVFVGCVEHVQNPNQFWVRTQKRNDDFEEMMTTMRDHFSQVKLDEDVLLNPEPGKLCCALYEGDMHFYRGVVIDTLEHGSEVFFIDFGNTEKVPHKLIKEIPSALASKSAFAFCCTLVNVLPFDEVWTSVNCDFFRRSVTNKALLVHVVQMRKDKFVVDLCEMGSDSSQSLSEHLIASKQAEYWNNIPVEPIVQKNTDGTEDTECSDINGNTEQVEDFKEEENQEEKICKNESDNVQAPPRLKALSTKPGCEFSVCCSDINSPSDFWCQPLNKAPALEKLMDKVQLFYSTHTSTLQSEDLCCVAKSPEDGKWYRAFILEKQKGHAKVILVDYGRTIQIKEDNLQAILPEFVHLEGQAFRCSLHSMIEPVDPTDCGSWSPQALDLLKDFVHDCTDGLRCNVVSLLNLKNTGLCNIVDLYNTKTKKSITNVLLEQGLAREVPVATKQLSTEFPESFVFSAYDIIPGNEEQVYVSHVKNQCEVYCHLERNTGIIEELGKKILEESEKMMQASMRSVVRKLCLAKYFDGNWYRGLVHPVQSPLHLSVFFVDYGNTSISEQTHVMFIPRDSASLLYTPMQAVRFNLASVAKEELYADVKEWLDKAVLNKQVRAVIVGKREDGSFDVELFDGEVNINEKVKELITSLAPKPKTVVSYTGSTKTKHLQIRTTKTSVRRSPSANRKSQAGTPLCKNKGNTNNYGRHGVQAKNTKVKPKNKVITMSCAPPTPQETAQVRKQRESHDTNTKSELPQYTKKTETPQLSCLPDRKVTKGSRMLCFASHIDSVNSFFLQLSGDEPDILKLVEDLNSRILRDSLKTTTTLRTDDIVLAEYEKDGGLYRSTVKDHEGSSRVKVEFVDYGNSAVVGKEKVYAIPKEYLSQARFSIPCSLLDPSTYKDDMSFTNAVMEKPLMVEFVHQCETRWQIKVEILDEVVPAPLEAVVDGSKESGNEKTHASSFEIGDRSPELNYQGEGNETTVSEKVMHTPPTATVSVKLKVITCRRRRRKHIRNRTVSKKEQRKPLNYSFNTKTDCADAVMPLPIHARDTEICTVLSVLRNGNMYIRLKRASEVLLTLENCITDNLDKCKIVAEEDVKEGLECLVQVHNNTQWHRAVVQHVCEGKCQVLLVDHGITEEIALCSVRQQYSPLTDVPNLAVLCKVNFFGFSDEKVDKYICLYLKSMQGNEVKLVFVSYSEAGTFWKVEIIMNGLFLIRQNTIPLQQNEEAIPSPNQPQQLVFAPVDIDKAYSGFAAAVTTPLEFCVVLEDSLLVMSKVSILLEDLSGQVCPLPEAHLVPGTCCLLNSNTKNKWCRAEVAFTGTTTVLNLVDYGHYESIPYENCTELRRLPAEMTTLPKVIYPCILRGVTPVGVDGQWTDKAAVFFQHCLYQKNLLIFFREFVSNTHWKVDIVADDVHVAKELVDAGHASYTDTMLGLRFQEQSPAKTARHCPERDEEKDEKKTPRRVQSGLSHCQDSDVVLVIQHLKGVLM